MTRYGFLIDQDSCIGCHACTVACKAEHDVPLGVNRTWVKYIEKGTFPDTRRHFSVLRCNHCEDAPCITICPTGALFARGDGIVDFDDSRCIGCKACMNACPYDALYIDPVTSTAKKCNYCAHRVEVGLEPSCVVVCPTQSIVAGDLDDPGSRLARLVAREEVMVRAPEQGTRPKVFYKGADALSLDPLHTRIPDDGMIWADTRDAHPTLPVPVEPGAAPGRTVLTTQHPMPWTGKVSSYLVTKSVAGGTLMVAALLVLLGHAGAGRGVGVVPAAITGLFLALTGVLLVADLKQPRRFHYLVTRGNPRSWLVRGAWILAAYAVVGVGWGVAGLADAPGVLETLAAPAALLGAATAGYTAYLFGQCEGRDLWQTPLLLPLLLAQAVVAGASVLLVAETIIDVPAADALRWALVGGLAAAAAFTFAELTARGTVHVELAIAALTRGRYATRFWLGGIVVGLVVPAVLAAVAMGGGGDAAVALGAVAGVAAVAGQFAFEDAFVRAGQSVPLS
jgi:Fe-S-cluster-containing dehydrogenase component/formate-dependent nitrite reductase membrane component NrfD